MCADKCSEFSDFALPKLIAHDLSDFADVETPCPMILSFSAAVRKFVFQCVSCEPVQVSRAYKDSDDAQMRALEIQKDLEGIKQS